MYYLQSRYYDPKIGRFINADTYASTGTGILGYNMFAYCNNNPINAKDPDGHVLLTVSFHDDPTLNMFFGCGGNGGGCGGISASVAMYSQAVADFSPGETALLEKSTHCRNFDLYEEIISFDFSTCIFTENEFTLVSAAACLHTAVIDCSKHIVPQFNFGLTEAYASFNSSGIKAGVMATLWQPSVTFDIGGLEVSVAANIGSIGSVLKIGTDGVTLGKSGLLGLTVSVC